MGAAKVKTKSRFATKRNEPPAAYTPTPGNGPAVRVLGLKSLRKLARAAK